MNPNSATTANPYRDADDDDDDILMVKIFDERKNVKSKSAAKEVVLSTDLSFTGMTVRRC